MNKCFYVSVEHQGWFCTKGHETLAEAIESYRDLWNAGARKYLRLLHKHPITGKYTDLTKEMKLPMSYDGASVIIKVETN